MILNINDFEITCVRNDNSDFCSLKFVLNQSQFITVPFRVSNLQKEVIDKLKLFIDHQKEIVIDLGGGGRLWQIKKEYFLFDFIYEGEGEGFYQETYLICENNSIFRNGVRQFLGNFWYMAKS